MRRLILLAVLSALVLAKPKPETYKESEDFQYSRSSSDDGTKSGFYGAQRGNMGGNYERAHNMDTLAQHQMSGLVRQVDGELGEGARTRTGSVYTAANSRGIYGSGNYDLSNLQGRNFAEGESVGNSQSHSSLSSQNYRYGGQAYSKHSQDSKFSGYQSSRHTDQRQSDNLQTLDNSQGLGGYEDNNQANYNMKYHTQFGSRGHSGFDQSSAKLHSSSGYDGNSQAHYITTPVKVVMRPGGRVAIPISAPTYTVSQNVLSENTGENSDAEILHQKEGSSPTNKVKHYEASYSYRKQWEKHHAVPGDVSIVVPTENPFPKNSELYENIQLLQPSKNQLENANSQTVQSGNINSEHRTYSQLSSSRSKFQTGYDAQQTQSGFNSQQNHAGFNSRQSQLGSSSQYNQLASKAQQEHVGANSQQNSAVFGTSANEYGQNAQVSGLAADLTNAAVDVNSKPKSYHSSYSYHKSWERQGDPYVIKPVGGNYDSQASERLTAALSNNAAYSAHQYGSHSKQAHQSYSADCDDQGHVRVARSYDTDREIEQSQSQWEDLGQQTETKLENLEDLGQQQQNKWDNLQDLGQQTQNQWDNLQQLGQETQNQWDNLEQLGQQTQNQWDNLQQLGQQTQDKWNNLEDLGQQTHRDLQQHQNENLEDFSQQNQKEEALMNFEQQENNQNENIEEISQQTQKDASTNFEQQASTHNESFDIFSQHKQINDLVTNFEQQVNSGFVDQQFQTVNEQINNTRDLFHQSQQNIWHQSYENVNKNIDSYDIMKPIISQSTDNNEHISQQHEIGEKHINVNDKQNLFPLPSSNTEYNKLWNENKESNVWHTFDNQNTNEQYEHNFWHMNNFNNFGNPFENGFPSSSVPTSNTEHPLKNLWDKIDNIAGEVVATEVNTDDKNIFSHDYSNFNAQNQNVNNEKDAYGWNYKPVSPNVDTNVDTESKEENLGHHNLFDEQTQNTDTVDTEYKDQKSEHTNIFDEQTQNTTTTVLLPSISNNHPTPVDNGNTSKIEVQPTVDANKNKHSQDEGRGDIGPEETPLDLTIIDKPYKTPQEIEILSITKEALIPKEQEVLIQPTTTIKNKDENIGDELLVTNLNQQENTKPSRQYQLLDTVQSIAPSTTPTILTNTMENNMNVHSEQWSNQHNLDFNNNSTTYLQNQLPEQQIVQNVEIPENEQQQYEDFSQAQNSWISMHDLQQGYDQQNLEQEFQNSHQFEVMPYQNPLQDLNQQVQTLSSSLEDAPNKDQTNPSHYDNAAIVGISDNTQQINTPEIIQPIHISNNLADVNSKKPNLPDNEKSENSKPANIQSPVEASSEKPGFWKSVGQKFSSAKNKVYSWFSSS